ncbi:MAG: hypothetical protein ACP5J8_02555, partial [Minisyncoccia bacterium]
MSQTRNKIIVLSFFILFIIFISYVLISKHFIQRQIPKGQIKISVMGQNWDSRYPPDDISIPNIKLELFLRDDLTKVVAEGLSDNNGNFYFKNIDPCHIYWIRVDNN